MDGAAGPGLVPVRSSGHMASVLGQVLKNSSIYGLSNILSRFVGFLMIPVYTRYLSPGDYGTMEMLDLTSYVITMWVGFSVSSAIVRFYYEYGDEAERRTLVSTALLFVAAMSFAAVACLLPFSDRISTLLFGHPANGRYFVLVFCSIFFHLLIEDSLVYFQVRQEALSYVAFNTARLVLGLSLNVVFLVFLRQGVAGILYSGLITSVIVGVAVYGRTLYLTGLGFSGEKLGKLVSFGFPLIFSSFSNFVITFSDRYFLNAYSTLEEVGNYSLGYKMSMLISVLITNPFITTWAAKRFEIAGRPDADAVCARVFDYFAVVILFSALALSAFARDILDVVATPAFLAAAGFVPLVALGYVLSGFYYHFNYGILLHKRTRIIAAIMASGAAVNVVLNYLLIPRLHGMGAALATTLSYFYIAAVTYAVAQRLHPLSFRTGQVGLLLLLAAALYGASTLVPPGSPALAIPIKAALVAVFPAVILVSGFFTAEERRAGKAFFSKMRGYFGRAAA